MGAILLRDGEVGVAGGAGEAGEAGYSATLMRFGVGANPPVVAPCGRGRHGGTTAREMTH